MIDNIILVIRSTDYLRIQYLLNRMHRNTQSYKVGLVVFVISSQNILPGKVDLPNKRIYLILTKSFYIYLLHVFLHL